MGHQIDLDQWQSQYIADLLQRGSNNVARTGRPMEVLRKVIEEDDGCYEVLIWTLVPGYVIEQMIASGGPLPPVLVYQTVYNIDDYPDVLLKKNKERFSEVTSALEAI